jgi:Transcriptional regulator
MDRIFSMRVFSRVAETGNFSVVAKHMECSAGNISRAVVSLEAHLHTRLLQRTTRHVSLTECGERYYHRCKKILADLDDAEAEASDAHTLPRGRLRVHAVPDIGLKQLTSTIVEYRQAFPAVSVDLKLLPRMANLVEDEFDVSIVSALALPDSRNVSRLIGRCERMLVAAPDYLARHPITTVDDLPNHTFMHISSTFDPPPGGWLKLPGMQQPARCWPGNSSWTICRRSESRCSRAPGSARCLLTRSWTISGRENSFSYFPSTRFDPPMFLSFIRPVNSSTQRSGRSLNS